MTEGIEPKWFVGIDWASQEHQVWVQDSNGGDLGERGFHHGGKGLGELCDWLIAVTGGEAEQIAVAIEVSHGPVVEVLLERRFQVFAINPKQLDRFRDRFSPAGAKDDSRDALALSSSLRTDRHCFQRLTAEDPRVIELREWSRMAEQLQKERNRLGNRLREQLWRYYPQALELGGDLAGDWFLALWTLMPTPAKARRARKTSIERILKTHRIRRIDAAEVLRLLRQRPLDVAPGTVEAASAHIRILLPRLRLLNQQIRQAGHKLDQITDSLAATGEENEPGQHCEQHDVVILRSLPGIGRIIGATLLAEASEPLRRRDYHALRALCGVAPVTRRSGRSKVVVRRLACNRRLRAAAYHWARVASQKDELSRVRYKALRDRGHSHARALRTVADRLLAVACAMLSSQSLFDPHAGQRTDQAA